MPRNDEAVSVLPYGNTLYYSYKQPFVLATDTRPHVRYVTHSPIYQYDYYTDQGPSEEEQRTKLTMLAANGLAVSSEVDVDVSSTFEAVHQKRALFTVPGGLLIINVEDATKPTAQAFFNTTGWPEQILFEQGELLIAAGRYGIYRFPSNEWNLLDR